MVSLDLEASCFLWACLVLLQELQAIIKKKQQGAKRKLSELQSTASQLFADAEVQISKSKRIAAKMPQLARLLKAFV